MGLAFGVCVTAKATWLLRRQTALSEQGEHVLLSERERRYKVFASCNYIILGLGRTCLLYTSDAADDWLVV